MSVDGAPEQATATLGLKCQKDVTSGCGVRKIRAETEDVMPWSKAPRGTGGATNVGNKA